MRKGLLVLLSAPSGTGKTSLVDAALAADPRLVVSTSHTTRQQRSNESDGVNYFFVDKALFAKMAAKGDFLEYATVFGNQYGTAKSAVRTLRENGQDVILEIDWQGAAQVNQLIPDALSIFILPPSIKALRERLTHRGQDSLDSIETRLAEAQLEMSHAHTYQYLVVNDDFNQALADILAIFKAARLRTSVQIANNDQIKAILSGT
ncbi:MAG: guanylate kinase [Gammaproteobacteria bacterium]|nr:guanylate kinase [Gammaproteobacteria bacterium]